MRAGDFVRFRAPHWFHVAGMPEPDRPWLLGLLIEYHTWEKIATILYSGSNMRIAARGVQLASRTNEII